MLSGFFFFFFFYFSLLFLLSRKTKYHRITLFDGAHRHRVPLLRNFSFGFTFHFGVRVNFRARGTNEKISKVRKFVRPVA